MSVNKHLPHVYVLPEDDANRQLATGFRLDPLLDYWKMRILGEAGGWKKVVDIFVKDHVPEMDRWGTRLMVLLIDFDRQEDRLNTVKAAIPERLKERVFVLGAWNEPEKLKPVFGPYEKIGSQLAKDCREGTETTWSHDLLRHNAGELARLREQVRPFLFADR